MTAVEPTVDLLNRPGLRFRASIAAAWRDRGVAIALAERSIKARYKRSLIGFAWVLLTPIAYMLVFTVLFDRVVKVDTHGVPYGLFSYSGLVPWSLFSAAVSSGSQSIVNNLSLVNRLAVSRQVYPLSTVLVAVFDAAVTLVVFPVLFLIAGRAPSSTVWWVVVIAPMHLLFTVAAVLIVAAVLPYLRDLRQVIPLLMQLLMLVTPVAYGLWAIPSQWHLPISIANPMAPIIDSYRRCLLMHQAPDWHLLGPAAVTVVVAFAMGVVLFERLQRGFADVA
jgi:lipopolysaccharide transport system permease protein